MKKSKDLKLLRKSIKHWCLDIKRPLLNGDEISDTLSWKSDNSDVKMFSTDCALCMEYSPTCTLCPLNIIGEKCTSENGAYVDFYWNSGMESANNMIKSLVRAYRATISEENDGV